MILAQIDQLHLSSTDVENTLNRNKFGDYLEGTEFPPVFDFFLGYFVS
jgi:hypothetical protein